MKIHLFLRDWEDPNTKEIFYLIPSDVSIPAQEIEFSSRFSEKQIKKALKVLVECEAVSFSTHGRARFYKSRPEVFEEVDSCVTALKNAVYG